MAYIEQWIDYSARTIPGAKIRAAGYTGAIRYIDAPNLLGHKHTTRTEYLDHLNNGLTVQLVFEDSTDDPDGGYSAGAANAQRAKAGADYLGYDGVVYFANDRSELPSVVNWTEYLRGARSVLGSRVGAYGFANALNTAKDSAFGFWQAGRESDLVPHADVYQWNNGRVYVDGVECDLNKVIRIYTPGGGSTPGPEIEDEEMPEPKRQPVSPGVRNDTLYWNGLTDGVLNIVPTATPVFMGPVLCWGPGTGLNVANGRGGGNSLVPGVNPARVEVNQPGAYRIPKGTTRVFYSYSCASEHLACIERAA
ncbi:glycoside hydrolase domain-containing protein [Amycolatopsis sp. NPDC051903]|uniref:glycoside hydrolase domain-containing protein n=1 Tax=Amycolatopsis sp. NPDC051903 TaxID=3363936 RepID=UPI00378DBFE3